VRLFSDAERTQSLELSVSEDELVATGAPAGVPLYLEVEAEGPYRIELAAAGWMPVDDPVAPPVEVELRLEVPDGFRCLADGASLPLQVTVLDAGAEPLQLELLTATSDPAWQLVLQADAVGLASGESIVVPASIGIAPGGCSVADDRAVTVAALAADGGLVSTMLTLEPETLVPGQVFEAPM
jgi:hypothetical protein